MKIAFISDYVSIHQKSFCDEMFRCLGDDFTFIATTVIREERIKMGWVDFTSQVDYAVHASNFSEEEFRRFLEQYEVIVIGSSHKNNVQDIINKKIVFYYQERPLKKGVRDLLNLKRLLPLSKMIIRQKYEPQLLAASAFAYSDYKKIGCFYGRAWKWGYFIEPITKQYIPRNNEILTILWVGRFLPLKHCEMVLKAAKEIKEKNITARFVIIGTGVEENNLKLYVEQNDLQDIVQFVGSLPNNEVRERMKRADVFLFTSDKNEGWGVVLNEAMSAGCCCIASDAIGSAPFLIVNDENGILFKCGDQASLNESLLRVIRDDEFRVMIGCNAVETMNNTWSPRNAAENLILLTQCLLSKNNAMINKLIERGPCSPCK